MKVTTLIFSYRGDQELAYICSKFVKSTIPDSKIVIADDGFNGATYEWRKKYVEEGYEYIQTTWPRFGNLLGPDHLTGASQLMAELAKDCDIILKIDPDACLLRKDWIEMLYNDPEAVISSSYKTILNYPMGNSYAVKSSVCEALAEDAKTYPGWTGCFEDYEIAQRIARQFHKKPSHALRFSCSLSDGFILTNPWDINIKLCIDSCRVYCSGYQFMAQPTLDKKVEYKKKQIEVHQLLFNELQKARAVMVPIPEVIESKTSGDQNLPQMYVPHGPTGGNLQFSGPSGSLVAPNLMTKDVVCLDVPTNQVEASSFVCNTPSTPEGASDVCTGAFVTAPKDCSVQVNPILPEL